MEGIYMEPDIIIMEVSGDFMVVDSEGQIVVGLEEPIMVGLEGTVDTVGMEDMDMEDVADLYVLVNYLKKKDVIFSVYSFRHTYDNKRFIFGLTNKEESIETENNW